MINIVLINIFFYIFLTTISGIVIQSVWYLGRKLCRNKNPMAVCIGLKVVCVSYLVPAIYIMSWKYFGNSFFYIDEQFNIVKKAGITPLVKKILIFLALIWGCVLVCILAYRISQYIKWKNYIKDRKKENDEVVLKIMKECQKRVNVKNVPKIYKKSGLSTPLCTGVFSKMILLPDQKYGKEELEVIFMHELTHIKNHDLELKWMSVVITMLHWFNPMVYRLFEQISIWSEIQCDIYVCKKSNGIFTIKDYYNIILNMILQNKNKKVKDFIITALAEKSSEIKIRVQYMKDYRKTKEKMRIIAVVSMIIALLNAFFVSYILATGILNYYDKFVKNNFSMSVESIGEQGEKTVDSISQIEGTKGKEWIERIVEERNRYIWNLKSEKIYKMKDIYCDSKTELIVRCSVFKKYDKYITVGIIEPNGNVRFVEDKNVIVHMFRIEEEGKYSIFIQNRECSDFKIYFAYYLETEQE